VAAVVVRGYMWRKIGLFVIVITCVISLGSLVISGLLIGISVVVDVVPLVGMSILVVKVAVIMVAAAKQRETSLTKISLLLL
jgi:hypothetical protein